MDQFNNITLHDEDSKLFLDVIATIYILQKQIDLLEYTGEFHSDDQETCEHLINSLRNIVMKKTIIISYE
jgi:hypothetical protein